MRYPLRLSTKLTTLRHTQKAALRSSPLPRQLRHGFFTKAKQESKRSHRDSGMISGILSLGIFTWWLYPSEDFARLSESGTHRRRSHEKETQQVSSTDRLVTENGDSEETAWGYFARQFEFLSVMTDLEWVAFSDRLVDAILPEWSKLIPGYVKKLQRELSASPGSLADEIWQEAHDPLINPEIRFSANVRVSPELCPEEREYLLRRRVATREALAKYLELDARDIHPDDVPTIAMCGSGGGLRALIAGTGSLLATQEDGLFDCATYTAGVSGSCWLQTLYLTSFAQGNIGSLLNHLKSRASTHIAEAQGRSKRRFWTCRYIWSSPRRQIPNPKGELGVNAGDFKISNQRQYLRYGQLPLPIYTAVRHEIPEDIQEDSIEAIETKEKLKKEPYFQWFEITPYEFFCEEFGAGIPTWALGRRFREGKDVPPEHGFHLPEIRTPLLMGIFGSAFCATLSHYYREIRPLIRTMTGFGTVDEMISGRDDDLSKVHPIDPATIPNFAYQMHGMLPRTTPKNLIEREYIQLMDAGMSNNLPIYPLLRPGRDVDILVAFDASADIKTDNWLSVADGYARQRGIKGWPVGIGWPKAEDSASQTRKELSDAQAETTQEAERKVQEAQVSQQALRKNASNKGMDFKPAKPDEESKYEPGNEDAGDLGYCTVWVGTSEERSSDSPPISKPVTDANSWQLMEPNAGLTVVYLPFLSNKSVSGVSPGTTEFLSTWNFVYTSEQIDDVVRLARANYNEGREQIRTTVRAVYERKKQLREQAEARRRLDRYHNLVKRDALLGHGDQFS
ncbi:Phospholipase A2 group IVB-like protein [Cladobotryum mycophilum]|uniref:Lysophospholipase n=1 Tax=Cladobotryum mycophilum TaxID=491253 RepID=A0ABR0T1B7_9HYPO